LKWADEKEETDPNFVFKLPSGKFVDATKLAARSAAIARRINGRFKGLLEVRLRSQGDDCFKYLDFLHRTVKDFLTAPAMQELLHTWTPSSFNASLVICKTTLAEVKTNPIWRDSSQSRSAILQEFFYSAKQYEDSTGLSTYKLFRKLESTNDSEGNVSTLMFDIRGLKGSTLWIKAVSCGVRLAVGDWLDKKAHRLTDTQKGHLLVAAIAHSRAMPTFSEGPPDLWMMKRIWKTTPAVLSKGQLLEIRRFVYYADANDRHARHEEGSFELCEAMKLLLEHGTDLSPLESPEAMGFTYDGLDRTPRPFLNLPSTCQIRLIHIEPL
jgi:hypothetical protein